MKHQKKIRSVVICGLFVLVTGSGCMAKRSPLFLNADFDPRQVDTITVLQPLDLRYDKSMETDFVSLLGKQTKRWVKYRKYKAKLNKDLSFVANISEKDLENPSPDWIRNLGPKEANWIMLLSIEYVTRFFTTNFEGIAEIRGILFDKNSGTVVWRGVGKGYMPGGLLLAATCDNDAVRSAAMDLTRSLPRKKDNIAEYQKLDDPNIPLDYDKDSLPEKGMTKQEVQELFGETGKIESYDTGETWYYHLNKGAAFIGIGYTPRVWAFHFNNEGTLIKYHFTDKRMNGKR